MARHSLGALIYLKTKTFNIDYNSVDITVTDLQKESGPGPGQGQARKGIEWAIIELCIIKRKHSDLA